MGYMRHNAIVVTSYSDELIETAHKLAVEIFEDVSTITPSKTNGYQSFLVPPDGSKEGWDESDAGDKNRDKFIAWLDSQRYDDGSTSLDWVEVQYGDDNRETIIIRDSDVRLRNDSGKED